MMPVFSTRGTTKPEPFSGCAIASRLNARATVAADAYGMSPQSRASAGAGIAQDRRRQANAGVATTTRRALNASPARALRRGTARRRTTASSTAVFLRTESAGSAASSALTSSLSPPGSDLKRRPWRRAHRCGCDRNAAQQAAEALPRSREIAGTAREWTDGRRRRRECRRAAVRRGRSTASLPKRRRMNDANRLVAGIRPPRHEHLDAHADLAGPREQPRPDEWSPLGGNPHHRRGGKRRAGARRAE